MSKAGIDTQEAMRVAAFRAALRGFLRTSEQVARSNGLTPQRHLLLLMIKGAPDGSESATVSDLAERLQLAQSTVTELVQRAIEAGLLVRQTSSDDARVGILRLSDEAERRFARAFHSHQSEREILRQTLAALEVPAQDGAEHDRPVD